MTGNTAKKFVFFFGKNWQNVLKVFMLSILFVSGSYAIGNEQERKEWLTDGPAIRGTVRFKDAEPSGRQNQPGGRPLSVQSEAQQPDPGREALAGERDLLHKKLIEIMERYQRQNEDYRRLRLSIAATLASGEKHQAGKREDQLMEALAKVTEDGRRLALKSVEFCDYVDALVRRLSLERVQQAEFALQLDGLRREARKAWYLVANPEADRKKIDKCRILAVDDDLQIVVLPIGLDHGVFCGLSFYVDKNIELRVIVVKPHFSAAMVTKGSIRDLAPGMEARTDKVPVIENTGAGK